MLGWSGFGCSVVFVFLRRFFCAALCLSFSLPAGAEPSALEAARARFLEKIQRASLPATQSLDQALTEAEERCAQAGDYQSAELYQRRREELATYLGGSAIKVQLEAKTAKCTGTTEARGQVLTGWRTANCSASWKELELVSGAYEFQFEVEMRETPTQMSQGRMPALKANFQLQQGDEKGLRFSVERSDENGSYELIRVGPIQLRAGGGPLVLKPEQGYPLNQILFREMRLLPVNKAAAPQSSSAEAQKNSPVTQAQTQFYNQLRRALTAELAAQTEKLADLETTHPEQAPLIQSTRQQLTLLKNQLLPETEQTRAAQTGRRLLRRILNEVQLPAGWREFDQVTLEKDALITGDRLTVKLRTGEKREARLVWAECANTSPDLELKRRWTQRFKLQAEQEKVFVRTAAELVQQLLSEQSFSMLMQLRADAEGTHAALVYLPELGLLQAILVEQGLAVVPKKSPLAVDSLAAIHKNLLQTEALARQQGRGIWALTPEKEAPVEQP
jgi:endonuclease YncB( thermonuclease family)